MLAVRLNFEHPRTAAAVTAVLAACGVTLALVNSGGPAITAQIVHNALLATIGIFLSRLLHIAMPSDVRTGVASGVSTLSWLTFLPCSLLFGAHSASTAG